MVNCHSLQLQCSCVFSLGAVDIGIDCTKFRRDIDIIRVFPFSVQLNPLLITNKTYAIINDNSQVEEFYVQYETTLPLDVFCLINLRTLKVIGTPFAQRFELDDLSISTGLPSLISRLNRLNVLSLINTTASHISFQALAALPNLTTLEVNNCGLREIPSTISTLTHLRILRLPHNHLSTLPRSHGNSHSRKKKRNEIFSSV